MKRKSECWRGRNGEKTNHVDQVDLDVGGISRDGGPSDTLSGFASIPESTFHGARDGDGQSGGDEQEGCGEYGGGTHCFSWKGQEGVKEREVRGKREEDLSST